MLEICKPGEKSLSISRFDTLQKQSQYFSVAASCTSDCSEVEEDSKGESACIFTGSVRDTGAVLGEMTDIYVTD